MVKPILRIEKLVEGISEIGYAKEGDAALDLRASGSWTIDLESLKRTISSPSYDLRSGERILINTGIRVAIPSGYFGSIRGRSSLALEYGLQVLGGVIDANYRGEVGIIVVNTGIHPCPLTKNQRVAQMVIQPCVSVEVQYCEKLDETNRDGGFGSTGTH